MVVGITGGIGSGKSTVVERLKIMGKIAVYNADFEAKKLMNGSKVIREKLIALFGEESFTSTGLNRSFIADIVFNNKKKLRQLNSIVHPEVFNHLNSFITKNQSQDYILYENAILFENKSDEFCDYIITVIADTDKRIQRVIERDGITKQEVEKRINNQWKADKKVLLSNYIITNNCLKTIDSQIVEIHNNLTKKNLSI